MFCKQNKTFNVQHTQFMADFFTHVVNLSDRLSSIAIAETSISSEIPIVRDFSVIANYLLFSIRRISFSDNESTWT